MMQKLRNLQRVHALASSLNPAFPSLTLQIGVFGQNHGHQRMQHMQTGRFDSAAACPGRGRLHGLTGNTLTPCPPFLCPLPPQVQILVPALRLAVFIRPGAAPMAAP